MASKGSILIVDDDEIILKNSAEILQKAGFEVQAFHDRGLGMRELLNMLDRTAFAAIVTDNKLKDTTGIQLAEFIRNDEGPNQYAPIVMQTRDANEGVKLNARKVGIHSVVSKDSTEYGEHLVHAVEDAIAERQKSGRKVG